MQENNLVSKYFIFTFLFICVFLSIPVSAKIYISEVLYNPLITESGGEAVELYNSGDEAIDLSGYTIKTASVAADATLSENSIIPSKGYFLVADSSWIEKRDSLMYPDADYEEPITMLNTNSGVALIDNENNSVDAVGWGDSSLINPDLFTGQAANYTLNGESLKRVSFTSSNDKDFISSQPDFENSKGEKKPTSSGSIDLSLVVTNSSIELTNFTMDSDVNGITVLYPGMNKQFNFSFKIENSKLPINTSFTFDGERGYFTEVEMSSYSSFKANLSLPYYLSAGNHTLSITIEKSGEFTQYDKNVNIAPMVAFDIDLDTLNCSLSQPGLCEVFGDSDFDTSDKPTIKNIGNTDLDFKLYASNLTSQTSKIDIKNVKFSFNEDEALVPLSEVPTLYPASFSKGPDSYLPLSLSITLPQAAKSGAYSSKLFLIGVSNG